MQQPLCTQPCPCLSRRQLQAHTHACTHRACGTLSACPPACLSACLLLFPVAGGFSGSGELSAPRYVIDEAGNLLYEYDTAYIENRCGQAGGHIGVQSERESEQQAHALLG